MSKRVLVILSLAPAVLVAVVIWRIVSDYKTSAEGNFYQWGSWVSAGITFLALITAAAYYFRAVTQARRNHEFDVLMRTVAVYHDLLPTKRALSARALREPQGVAVPGLRPEDELALIDLMNFFDEAAARALTVFTLSLGDCSLDKLCKHPWRPSIQQRHEGVRQIIREIGYPGFMYHSALLAARQDVGRLVREFPLKLFTEFERFVSAVHPFVERIVYGDRGGTPIEREAWMGDARSHFLAREVVVRMTRPDADVEPISWKRRLRSSAFRICEAFIRRAD